MARPKAKPTIIHTGAQQQLRWEFLGAIAKVCPEVSGSLYHDVFLRNTQTLHEWSGQYHCSNTWIEDAAKSTLNIWKLHPNLAEARQWSLHIVTRDAARLPDAFDKFEVSLPVHLPSLLFAETSVEAHIDAAVQKEKHRLKLAAMQRDDSRTAMIPSDRQTKMECTAMYVLRGMSPEQISKISPYRRHMARISVWIKDTLTLLELPRRVPGRPRKNLAHNDEIKR